MKKFKIKKEAFIIMELYNRKDFIQIDYRNGDGFVVSCLKSEPLPMSDKADFNIMGRFGEDLLSAIKFTLGAMSAVKLFQHVEYLPTQFVEIVFAPAAKERIKAKKYHGVEFIYSDLRILKKRW
jgi:hypothetical protein